ncbi:phage head closure protein [Salinicola sp. V024]|uniref:phage head closure protein n=1 Tax=Salinicola sp. V024 TaxID=3459609 RepID=UPI004044A9A0
MRAGRLRHRITFQKKMKTREPATGAVIYAWTDIDELVNVPADVQFLSAKELMSSDALQSSVSARIIIRYRSYDFDSSMRIVYKNKIYDILGVIPDNETGRTHITFPVKQGPTDG